MIDCRKQFYENLPNLVVSILVAEAQCPVIMSQAICSHSADLLQFLLLHGSGSSLKSLTPGKFEWYFRYQTFQIISVINGWGISCELALRWTSLDLTDDKSTLVQVMAWCRQATCHYLSQCWPRSMLPFGVTRPQWVKDQYPLVMINSELSISDSTVLSIDAPVWLAILHKHYNDVIMGAMASQITSLPIVYSTVYSFRRRSKKKSKLCVTGLCAWNSPWPVNSPHKWAIMRKMFPFDDVIMRLMSCRCWYKELCSLGIEQTMQSGGGGWSDRQQGSRFAACVAACVAACIPGLKEGESVGCPRHSVSPAGWSMGCSPSRTDTMVSKTGKPPGGEHIDRHLTWTLAGQYRWGICKIKWQLINSTVTLEYFAWKWLCQF